MIEDNNSQFKSFSVSRVANPAQKPVSIYLFIIYDLLIIDLQLFDKLTFPFY